MLSGPPGSGKTLVLAGRAKYLAARHPDWRIVVLCYNNSLVPYLSRWWTGTRMWRSLRSASSPTRMGHKISLNGAEQAAADLAGAKARGIDRSWTRC